MSTFDKKQIDLLKAIAELFYEKIRPDTRFRHKRIDEWCKNLPLPPVRTKDSEDTDALNKIAILHRQLELIDDENSVKGSKWAGFILDRFSRKLEELKATIQESDVDPSIYNLYHVHNSVLFRAKGSYSEALDELENSTILLRKKIQSYEGYLPGYTREIFMNSGASSELHRLNGNIPEAVSAADEMHRLSMKESDNSIYHEKDNAALCPSTSWALYYCCEAHLAVENWDELQAKTDREWYFSQTFSQDVYRDWTVPVLIRIIGNIVWEQRYPDYFDKIADLVYVGTSKGKLKTSMRELSVYLGRVRLKPTMPLTLLTLVAMLTIKFVDIEPNMNKGGQVYKQPFVEEINRTERDYKQPLVELFDELEDQGFKIEPSEREKLEKAIIKEVDATILNASHDENKELEDAVISDRGVGVGQRMEAYAMLPQMAYASDRGVGVG